MAQQLSETLKPGLSYWLAYDESLEPHMFRVIKYMTTFETFWSTEYGTVSFRQENHYRTVSIKPKGRKPTTVIYGEDDEVSEQELLSLLIFWTAKPLFLAVPVPDKTEEQNKQESLF